MANQIDLSTDIAIIGGGIVGCAIAYELSTHGYQNIVVIEKNPTIPGLNQSSRNGGIIHAGIYYPKDIEPLKAKLCVEGNRLMYQFCQKYNLPHRKTGKLLLAKNKKETELLEFVFQIAEENGVPGVKIISGVRARALEPNIANVPSALYVPSTGSTALGPIVEKLKLLAETHGVHFILEAEVTNITSSAISFDLTTSKGSFHTTILINAAGLYADKIAKMTNSSLSYEIDPARGELYEYDQESRANISVQMHVYGVPYFYDNASKQKVTASISQLKELLRAGKITKTLGPHVSPTFRYASGHFEFGKSVAVGPLKTLTTGKDDYTGNLKTPADYINALQPIFPNLNSSDLKPRFAGIMAVLKGHTDFVIEKDPKFPLCIHLVGMDSPAWTASLAIAKYVKNLLEK